MYLWGLIDAHLWSVFSGQCPIWPTNTNNEFHWIGTLVYVSSVHCQFRSSDSENRLAKTFSVVLYYRFLNDNIWSKIESYDRWTGARMSRAVRKFQYQSVWILPFPWKDRMASVGMYSTFSPGLEMIEHMRFKQASLNRIKKL